MTTRGPIRILPRPYKGQDPKKSVQFQAEIDAARKIEDYLNGRYVAGKPDTFLYHEIAQDLNMKEETVAKLLKRIGGGSGGITL
jgi:hypothetical protein